MDVPKDNMDDDGVSILIETFLDSVDTHKTVKASIEAHKSTLLCTRCDKDISSGSLPNVCKNCKTFQYCSIDCQRSDWYAGHNAECKAICADASWLTCMNSDDDDDILSSTALRHMARVSDMYQYEQIGVTITAGRVRYEAAHRLVGIRSLAFRDFQQLMSEHASRTIELFSAKRQGNVEKARMIKSRLTENATQWEERLNSSGKIRKLIITLNNAISGYFNGVIGTDIIGTSGKEKASRQAINGIAEFFKSRIRQDAVRDIQSELNSYIDCIINYAVAGSGYQKSKFYKEASECIRIAIKIGKRLDRDIAVKVYTYTWPKSLLYHHNGKSDYYAYGRTYAYHGVKCKCAECVKDRVSMGIHKTK